MIQKLKNHRDAVSPDDDAVNFRLYAVCDLAMGIISTREITSSDMSCIQGNIQIRGGGILDMGVLDKMSQWGGKKMRIF